MVINTKNRQLFEREQDFLECARSYLAEAFPNPEREGCPPDEKLRILASRPMHSEACVSDHLTCCSPCFNAYMAHLSHERAKEVQSYRIERATWIRRSLIAAGIAAILMIAIYMFFPRRNGEVTVAPHRSVPSGGVVSPHQVPAIAMYVPVLVDLSNASPVRGLDQSRISPAPQLIPPTPLIDLTLQLPLGSEDRRYWVRLSSNKHVVWSGSARAHLENGQTRVHIHADFTAVPPGTYNLVVVSNGSRLRTPVTVKSISSGRTQ